MTKIPQEVLDHYFPPTGGLNEVLEHFRKELPRRNDIAHILFVLHDHEHRTEKIVYHEADIMKLLELLGHPVEWGE